MYPTLTRGSSSSSGGRGARRGGSTGIATASRSTRVAAASASGVCTVPCRTGRSAVASYRRSVMSLRARFRNSSGGVVASRSPARLSATSGWLLTFSGTVALDQQLQGIHRNAKPAVHVPRIHVMDLARPQLVDTHVDRARPQLADAPDDEE